MYATVVILLPLLHVAKVGGWQATAVDNGLMLFSSAAAGAAAAAAPTVAATAARFSFALSLFLNEEKSSRKKRSCTKIFYINY